MNSIEYQSQVEESGQKGWVQFQVPQDDNFKDWLQRRLLFKFLDGERIGDCVISVAKLQNRFIKVKLHHPKLGYRVINHLLPPDIQEDVTIKVKWDMKILSLFLDDVEKAVSENVLPLAFSWNT